MAAAAEAGFAGVELNVNQWDEQLARRLRAVGLSCVAVHVPGPQCDFQTWAARAASLDAETLIVAPGARVHGQRAALIESLGHWLDAAHERRFGILVEPGRDRCLESLEEVVGVWLTLERRGLGVVLDTGALEDCAINPPEAVKSLADGIGLVRLTDRLAGRPVRPGGGQVHLQAVVRNLRRTHYAGWLVLEAASTQAQDLAQDHQWLCNLLADEQRS